MKTSRLIVHGALVVAALIAPSLSAADSKKRPFWNRFRQPKASAPAESPAPAPAPTAADPAAAAATAPAAGDPAVTATATPPPAAAAAPTTAAAAAAPVAAAAAPLPPPPANAEIDASAAAAVAAVSGKPERVTSGDKEIDRIIARMRTGPIGAEPSAVPYLDLIGTGQATPAEMNDFASYIARRGLVQDASVIQKRATELDPKNSTLWLNLGLIERGAGRPDSAGKAFERAAELDPANGPAWYNLGVIQDGNGQYDAAIESFRRALTIDPTLGDPKFNPQAINNNRLLVVRLMLAQQSAGTRGLSLAPMQEVAAAPSPAPPTKTPPETKTPPGDAPATPPPVD